MYNTTLWQLKIRILVNRYSLRIHHRVFAFSVRGMVWLLAGKCLSKANKRTKDGQ